MRTDPPLSQKIKRSLDASWKEGIPAAVMIGIMDHYLVPFGLFLSATSQQIGFLVAIPHLVGSFFLLFAVKAVGLLGSRLQFIVRMAALQAGFLLPMAFLALRTWSGGIYTLIFLMVIFRILFNLIGPAWGSLMSDYLPAERRGRYFGWRSQIVGAAQIIGMGTAGWTLSVTKETDPAFGFFLIFFAAAICRFLSAYYLSKMTDMPLHMTRGDDFTFLMFIRRFKESNFVKFVIYESSILFTAYLAASYFSVFMLRDLKFSYLTYMSIHLAGFTTSLLAFPIWGKHADIVGNARVLKITSLMLPVLPVLWLVSQNPFYLIAVEMFSGFAWGGFGLCATNFIYDAVTPAKRVRCLGYFNLINGVAIFLGASIGGFLADRLPPFFGQRMLTLFALSGILRFAAHFFLSRHFNEVRESSKRVSSLQLFFSVVGIRPLGGIEQEAVFPICKRFFRRRTGQ